MANPPLSYRRDIDGLRAIAVLSVIAFHAFPTVALGGFVGVDIFFVISGFLISSIILRAEHFSIADFYGRRIRRIFPALLLVMCTCLAFGWFVLLSDEYKQLGKHIAAGAGFLANIVFWQEAGYFDTAAASKPLLHLWSLGVEEQFYIAWPIILILTAKYRVRPTVVVLILGAASFSLNIAMVGTDQTATFYSPATRAWELLVGALLACPRPWSLSLSSGMALFVYKRIMDALSVLGAALIAFAVLSLNKNSEFPGAAALLPTLGAALIIYAGRDAIVNRTVLSNQVAVLIGLISYPLYLWHWPILSFIHIIEEAPSLETRAIAVAMSVVLAWLTYWLLERRVRRNKSRWLPIYLSMSLCVIAGTGYGIYSSGGFSFRHHELEARLELFDWGAKGLSAQRECVKDHWELGHEFCLRSVGKPISVALIGDSHANHLFYGLDRFYDKSGRGLINLGRGGCAPFYDWERTWVGHADNCRKYNNQLLDYIVKESNIETVLLLGHWGRYASKNEKVKFGARLQVRENLDEFTDAMDYTLERLVAAGKQVIFIFDTPTLNFSPKTCQARRPFTWSEQKPRVPCAMAAINFEDDTRAYRAKAVEVLQKHPSVKRWDASSTLCDSEFCWIVKDGKLLYMDGDHLSMEGSLYIGQQFLPE